MAAALALVGARCAPAKRTALVPWSSIEAANVKFAADWAGLTPKTVRDWCERHGLGRKVGGRWHVSRLAFAMFVEGDAATLARYHAGDRSSPEIMAYYARMQFPRF